MRFKQSFARWCFASIPIRELCAIAVEIGFDGIDLVDPSEWPILREHGLVCSLAGSHSIVKGLNDPANHPACETKLIEAIELSAANDCPNVVCFSGNRGAIDDVVGAANCVESLKRVAPMADEKGVTLCLELLNSKDHKQYMCDRTAWGVDVCQRVGLPNVKLLYDVYHMQRMEGDLIATIEANIAHIGHIHTAGCPGRHELDASQEIHYPAVLKSLVRTGYRGWIGHEFLPRGEMRQSLRQAFELVCNASKSGGFPKT